MRRKFPEKEGTLTLVGSLRIARSHEAVDRHMKRIVSNAGPFQVNVVVEASLLTRRFACGEDGHFCRNMHVVKHGGNVAVLDILKLGVPRLCCKAVENIEKLPVGVGDVLI